MHRTFDDPRDSTSVPAKLTCKEVAHCSGDFQRVCLQREVSGIEEAHDRVRHITFESLGTHWEEERIVLAPHDKEGRLVGAEIFLETWVERDVALVIAEQVELYLIGPRSGQVGVIEGVAVWRNQTRILDAVRVLPYGPFRR